MSYAILLQNLDSTTTNTKNILNEDIRNIVNTSNTYKECTININILYGKKILGNKFDHTFNTNGASGK